MFAKISPNVRWSKSTVWSQQVNSVKCQIAQDMMAPCGTNLQASEVLFSFITQKIASFGLQIVRRNNKQCFMSTEGENHGVESHSNLPGEGILFPPSMAANRKSC